MTVLKFEKLDEFLSKKKNIWLLYGIVSICILLLVFWGSGEKEPEAETTRGTSLAADSLSETLPPVLSEIQGVGNVRVAITYESGTEAVHARNKNGDSETVVTLGSGSGERAVLEKEVCPRVRGVLVVADGGGDATVRQNIFEAVLALTGAPAHAIAVFPAK